ncbi:hypothetical protein ACOMHN_021995 [Nucella lapillus]
MMDGTRGPASPRGDRLRTALGPRRPSLEALPGPGSAESDESLPEASHKLRYCSDEAFMERRERAPTVGWAKTV